MAALCLAAATIRRPPAENRPCSPVGFQESAATHHHTLARREVSRLLVWYLIHFITMPYSWMEKEDHLGCLWTASTQLPDGSFRDWRDGGNEERGPRKRIALG